AFGTQESEVRILSPRPLNFDESPDLSGLFHFYCSLAIIPYSLRNLFCMACADQWRAANIACRDNSKADESWKTGNIQFKPLKQRSRSFGVDRSSEAFYVTIECRN
ncbi:MAG: hypothetical protein WCK63_05115, partial [Betaproteobacteria bacterium]